MRSALPTGGSSKFHHEHSIALAFSKMSRKSSL
jgi:hypothetical protein